MRESRRHSPTRWHYPETRTYSPSGLDDRRDHQRPRSAAWVAVALVAACVSVFGLTEAADIQTVTHSNDKDVTAAVHKELQKMFLADLPHASRAIRSGVVPPGIPERIDYPQDVLALRCYGTESLGVSKILTDGTKKTRADIPCGGTALTLITNEPNVRAIIITPKGTNTWASWALTRPSSAKPNV
ncbi:hypothetical protein [Streptomyces sp. NPDC005004]